jgi:hypothetical protein
MLNSFLKGNRFLANEFTVPLLPSPQDAVHQGPDQAVGLAQAETKRFDDLGDGEDRAGGLEKEQNFQAVSQGLIHPRYHILKISYQKENLEYPHGVSPVKKKSGHSPPSPVPLGEDTLVSLFSLDMAGKMT